MGSHTGCFGKIEQLEAEIDRLTAERDAARLSSVGWAATAEAWRGLVEKFVDAAGREPDGVLGGHRRVRVAAEIINAARAALAPAPCATCGGSRRRSAQTDVDAPCPACSGAGEAQAPDVRDALAAEAARLAAPAPAQCGHRRRRVHGADCTADPLAFVLCECPGVAPCDEPDCSGTGEAEAPDVREWLDAAMEAAAKEGYDAGIHEHVNVSPSRLYKLVDAALASLPSPPAGALREHDEALVRRALEAATEEAQAAVEHGVMAPGICGALGALAADPEAVRRIVEGDR